MRQRSIVLLITILLLPSLWSSCSRETSLDSGRVYPLKIEKARDYRFKIVSKDGPFFGKIEDDDHLYVYFLSNRNNDCEILKIDENRLEVVDRYVVQKGVGPGEVQNPRIYGGNDRSVIIYDAPAFKYIEFDPRFHFRREYRLANLGVFLYSGGRYVPEDRLVVDGFYRFLNYYRSLTRIYSLKLEENGKTRGTVLFETPWVKNRKNRKTVAAQPIHFGCFFDHLYILDKRQYRLVKMSVDGKVIKKIKIAFEPKRFSEGQRKRWVERFYGSKRVKNMDYPERLWPAAWMLPIGGGIAVARCENYDPDVAGPIPADYFDPDLNYLGQITLPYVKYWNDPGVGQVLAHNNYFFKNGKLYTLEERGEAYWLVQWRVQDGGLTSGNAGKMGIIILVSR